VAVHREINDMMKRHFGGVPDRWLFNYAHAVVEPRVDRARAPRRFVLCVMLHSVMAALRWNRSVGPAMRRVLSQWGRDAYRL
jgi:hypothetical protein